MNRSLKIFIPAILSVFGVVLVLYLVNSNSPASRLYSYTIVNTFPHDPNAFTQGLIWENGVLYEGTGRNN